MPLVSAALPSLKARAASSVLLARLCSIARPRAASPSSIRLASASSEAERLRSRSLDLVSIESRPEANSAAISSCRLPMRSSSSPPRLTTVSSMAVSFDSIRPESACTSASIRATVSRPRSTMVDSNDSMPRRSELSIAEAWPATAPSIAA